MLDLLRKQLHEVSGYRTHTGEPQVIVVGIREDGVWHFKVGDPMPYERAVLAIRSYRPPEDGSRSATILGVGDPKVEVYKRWEDSSGQQR